MQRRLRSTREVWHKKVAATLVLLLALALLASPMPTRPAGATARAQPRLLRLARQVPGRQISVIVQKQREARNVERQVAALGGTVTLDLHIINAFAAELPAGAIPTLARADGVRWISNNAPVVDAGKPGGGDSSKDSTCAECIDTANLQNTYIKVIGADKVWNASPYLQGQGVTVAVVDSGINTQLEDLKAFSDSPRTLVSYKTSSSATTGSDMHGHGTHMAGIIGGNGYYSAGGFIGVAPKVNFVNIKVGDDLGRSTAADVVAGLQWIYENHQTYNIRVVNMSLNSTEMESYHTNPIAAAAEILWFNKIVVVVSAGNTGQAGLFPPANDPFVITVGATDDKGTESLRDDELASFSAFGTTVDGFSKPDLVAPGVNITSLLASDSCWIALNYPARIIETNKRYWRGSGTSMSAPMVAGAVALLLQDEPGLTPDQVKHRLLATAQKLRLEGVGAGYLDIYAAVNGSSTESANTGVQVSDLLTTGSEPVTWDSATWNSVNWGSVNWGSVNWGSVNWGSVNWGSDYWDY